MTKARRSRKPLLRGPEEWKAEAGESFSQWDRWLLAVLVVDHDGAWASLETALEVRRRGHEFEREDAEAKLCQLADLRARVQRAGLAPAHLLGDDLQDKRLLRKARTKVFDQYVGDRAKTRAMRETPRRVLGERARRGNWAGFPVSPSQFERVFLDDVRARPSYSLKATFGLERRLVAASSASCSRRSLPSTSRCRGATPGSPPRPTTGTSSSSRRGRSTV